MMVMITSKALAGASFEVIDGFKYILDSDTKTATLLPNTEKYAGDAVIPESVKAKDGAVYKITAIGDKCFSDCRHLTSITIPSSVTSLGGDCFSYCSSLTSITIPSSVTSLGSYCFSYCSSLTSITIQFMQQLMAILHPKRLRLHYIGSMPTWRMQPTSTRLEPVALWLLPMTASSAFRVLIMVRWSSSMQLMASLSAPLLPLTVPHPALYQKPWLSQNSVIMPSR